MPSKYEPMARVTNEQARLLLDRVKEWCNKTNTGYFVLSRSACVTDDWRRSVENGRGIMAASAARIQKVMDENPDGLSRIVYVPKSIREQETREDLQTRRDAVARERLERATALLAQEKPGFCGRKFTTRPIWEMPA